MEDRQSGRVKALKIAIYGVVNDVLLSIHFIINGKWIRFGGMVLVVGAMVLGQRLLVDGSYLIHPRSASNDISFWL